MTNTARIRMLFLIALPFGLLGSVLFLYLATLSIHITFALRNNAKIVEAHITERSPKGVKYRFQLSPNGAEFFRKQLGREMWSQPSDARNRETISVRYLPSDPYLNQPLHQPIPSGDDIAGIVVGLVFGLIPILTIGLCFVPSLRPRRHIFLRVFIGYSTMTAVGLLVGVVAGLLEPVIRPIFAGKTAAEIGYMIGGIVGVLVFLYAGLGMALKK